MAEVLRHLGLQAKGGNTHTVKKHIFRLGLDCSHFITPHFDPTPRRRYSLEEVLIEHSTYSNSSDLKRRLLKEEIFQRMCYSCRLTQWMGGDIPLELEHINGTKSDNRIENLTLLCPNCHALTPTYRGRNNCEEKPTCNCGVVVTKKDYLCRSCSQRKAERIDWPSTNDLSSMVAEKGYVEVARCLGVSDNAVRKRIKNHGSLA